MQTNLSCLPLFLHPRELGLSISNLKLDYLTGTWSFQKNAKAARVGGGWLLRAYPSFGRVLGSVALMSPS